MAHKANVNFHLYTGFNGNASQSFEAYEHLKAANLDFIHLHYNDPNGHSEVLNWANTAFANTPYAADVQNFPFVVYEKAFDIRDNPPREPVLVYGLNAIKATDWQALAAFEG